MERRKFTLIFLLLAEVNNADLSASLPQSYPFGWDPTADGFRGHVFATPDNSTVVVSIKGTSAALFGGGGPTARKDKLNDNLLFSCCCARVDWTWTTVCGCYRGGWNCDEGCLEEAMKEEGLFYPVGTVSGFLLFWFLSFVWLLAVVVWAARFAFGAVVSDMEEMLLLVMVVNCVGC